MHFQNKKISNRLSKTWFLLTAAIVGFALPSLSHAALVVNDSFADGNRTGQALPDSADWYSRQGTGTATVSSNTLTFDLATAPDNGVLSYFTDPGTPFALATGQGISLSFDLTVESSQSLSGFGDRIRFGLMNSGGSRETNNGSNFTSSTYNGYQGYWGLFSPQGFTGDLSSIRKRDVTNFPLDPTSDELKLTTTKAMTQLGSNFGHEQLLANTTYQFTLEVMKTSPDTSTITATVDGSNLTASFVRLDTSGTFDLFDTGVISLHDLSNESHPNSATSATISNISISAVPEPTAVGVWSLVSVALLMRRRASRASAASTHA